MNFEAYGKNIFIKELKQDPETVIHLPSHVMSGKGFSSEVMLAEVVSMGDNAGMFYVTTETKILVPRYAGVTFSEGSDTYKAIQEVDILGIVKE